MAINVLSRSKVFAEYLTNRQSIIELLRSAPPDSEQLLSVKKRKLATVVYCSCVLLLSSYLEKYVESLVVETIDVLNSTNLLVRHIPEPLRVVQIKEVMQDLSKLFQKDVTRVNLTKMLQESQSVIANYGWFLDHSQPYNKLSGEPLIGDNRFSNPSPEKIDILFRHLGINSLVGRVIDSERKPDRGAVRAKVTEMVNKRNDIAHTGGTVTVTREDVAAYLVYSRRLVRGIDALVGQEVQKLIGGKWPWI